MLQAQIETVEVVVEQVEEKQEIVELNAADLHYVGGGYGNVMF